MQPNLPRGGVQVKFAASSLRRPGARARAKPPAEAKPHAREVGPAGNVWFTGLGGVIGRFDVTTHAITLFSAGLSPGADPHEIITGPDGNLYFPEESGNRIGKFDMKTFQITEIA